MLQRIIMCYTRHSDAISKPLIRGDIITHFDRKVSKLFACDFYFFH